MKQILLSIFVLLLAVMSVSANPLGQRHKPELLEPYVERAVAAQSTKPIKWQQQLKNTQQAFYHVRYSYRENVLPPTVQSYLGYQEERTYLQRLLQIQAWVNHNPVLKDYTFAAPVPADLARLIPEKIEALRDFLQNSQMAIVAKTDRIRPFTLALSLGQHTSALEIWIDVPSKKVYLMSDNFYTSIGKYGIHLR